MRKAIEEGGGLSEEQHGFREGHSTMDTIQRVVDIGIDERQRRHVIRKDILLITLNIKNAYKSARRDYIMRFLE